MEVGTVDGKGSVIPQDLQVSGLWEMDKFGQRGQELGCGCVTLESPGGVSLAGGMSVALGAEVWVGDSRGRGWLIDGDSSRGHG